MSLSDQLQQHFNNITTRFVKLPNNNRCLLRAPTFKRLQSENNIYFQNRLSFLLLWHKLTDVDVRNSVYSARPTVYRYDEIAMSWKWALFGDGEEAWKKNKRIKSTRQQVSILPIHSMLDWKLIVRKHSVTFARIAHTYSCTWRNSTGKHFILEFSFEIMCWRSETQ